MPIEIRNDFQWPPRCVGRNEKTSPKRTTLLNYTFKMQTIPWNSDSKNTLTMYKNVLTFLGVWPFQNEGYLKIIHVGIILFSQVTIAIPQYIDLFFNWNNFDNTIENLTCNVVVNMVIVKLITLLIHRTNMADCVKLVIEDWRTNWDSDSRQIMKRHCTLGKIVFVGLSTMLYSSYVMYIMLAIVITTSTDCSAVVNVTGVCRMLPIPTNYLINTDRSPFYEIIFILQSVQGMITCTGNYGIDAFMFYLTMHVCGQLELLKIDFRDLPRIFNSENSAMELFQKRMKTLTKRHCELINFAENLEKTFNVMILGQLLVSSVMICLIGFQFILSLENGDLLGAGKYTTYMFAVMMQLFLYSYAGDYLQSQSFGLACAAYESPWYDLPPAVALDLLFVMIRAGNPLRISAGKFFIMTLESFKVIMKTSGSYLSVLRVMVK